MLYQCLVSDVQEHTVDLVIPAGFIQDLAAEWKEVVLFSSRTHTSIITYSSVN